MSRGELCGGGGGGVEQVVGVGGGGLGVCEEEAMTGVGSSLKSFSYASLRRFPSNSLFLAARMSLLSLTCLRSISVCLSLVLTNPSSILVCSCWNEFGDTGIDGFFFTFCFFVLSETSLVGFVMVGAREGEGVRIFAGMKGGRSIFGKDAGIMIVGATVIGGSGVEDATDAFIVGIDGKAAKAAVAFIVGNDEGRVSAGGDDVGKAVKAAVASIVGSDEVRDSTEGDDVESEEVGVFDAMGGVAVIED